MKRVLLSLAIAFVAVCAAQAQDQKECCKKECCKKECCKAEKKEKVTVVKIEDNNIFSQCFKDIDTNGDGIVDCCEAKKATFLSLERGGRSNVITNYDFLKYFPNLTALGLGNTPLEVVDLHNQTKLEKLHVGNALFLKKVIVGGEKAPEISGEQPDREAIVVEFYVEDPVARQLFQDGYQYVEPVKMDCDTYYVVSKEPGVYGLWHNGKLEVPCQYGYDKLKSNYAVVQEISNH